LEELLDDELELELLDDELDELLELLEDEL